MKDKSPKVSNTKQADTVQSDDAEVLDMDAQFRAADSESILVDIALKFDFILPSEHAVLLPGLVLTICIALISIYTGAQFSYVTPLVVAMGIGVLFRNAFILPSVYKPGILYSMRHILRFAVALLGVRITFEQILGLGWEGITIALVPLVLTFILTIMVGKMMKMNSSQAMLIATGTSICGASAIMTAGAVTRAKSDDVMVAVSSITIFGTFLMLTYPALYRADLLSFTAEQYGMWSGASIHEVAQVIAAAFGGGDTSGEIGTMIKLTRVAALVPFAFVLSYLATRGYIKFGDQGAAKGEVKFPFFILGFLGMVILNSNNFFTTQAVKWIEVFDVFLLTMSMGAMGLETDFKKLLKIGFSPFFLSIFATSSIVLISYLLVHFLPVN
jgi:uncharacterized integral membrane protein (TIGR00698 family)